MAKVPKRNKTDEKNPVLTEVHKILKKHDGKLTESVLQTALSRFVTSFDYSMERQTLTLTDREYGEQMIFDKR